MAMSPSGDLDVIVVRPPGLIVADRLFRSVGHCTTVLSGAGDPGLDCSLGGFARRLDRDRLPSGWSEHRAADCPSSRV